MQKMSKSLIFAKKMPPLFHKLPEEKYDVRKSEVVKWLLEQDEMLEYVFDAVRGFGFKESPIEYDSTTGKWQGVDYGK